MEWVTSAEGWIALITLTVLEIVLGIDNIIFLSILVSKLPRERQPRGRVLGLAFAMVTRIGLVAYLSEIAVTSGVHLRLRAKTYHVESRGGEPWGKRPRSQRRSMG